MKVLRKWSRILHRDLGFFFVGTSIIYGISGIALNHMGDWDPSYVVENKELSIESDLTKSQFSETVLMDELKRHDLADQYTNHYFPQAHILKVFLDDKSSLIIDTKAKRARLELIEKRIVFYEVNFLHYNPNAWWKWFSDIFAGVLIFLALSSLLMVRGKKGVSGRGGIYVVAGIIIPILILIFS
ncbi:MAG: PepSY-associated TM helix domain-containing protein [Bacteroidota bacterium]|nr:PepSY-associated TM helix domain-containing protein [Bacteroidota bacterium]